MKKILALTLDLACAASVSACYSRNSRQARLRRRSRAITAGPRCHSTMPRRWPTTAYPRGRADAPSGCSTITATASAPLSIEPKGDHGKAARGLSPASNSMIAAARAPGKPQDRHRPRQSLEACQPATPRPARGRSIAPPPSRRSRSSSSQSRREPRARPVFVHQRVRCDPAPDPRPSSRSPFAESGAPSPKTPGFAGVEASAARRG